MIRLNELSPKAEATRSRILETAASLFWRRNYHGVSLDEVAEKASVNKATIYRYYLDKAELATAVMASNGDRVVSGVFEPAFQAHDTPVDRLKAIYRSLYVVQSQIERAEGDVYGCPIVGLALELGQELPSLRESARDIFDRVETYFLVIASDAIATGRVSGWSKNTLARTLLQILHGALTSSRLSVEPKRILDAANASLVIISSSEKLSPETGDPS